MSNPAFDVLSNTVLRVDAAAMVSETLCEIRSQRASHVAIFAEGRCLGASSVHNTDSAAETAVYSDLIDGRSCIPVSDTTSLEDLGRVFENPAVDAQIVHDAQDEFVGVVTRQSLLEGLLKERSQVEGTSRQDDPFEPTRAESLAVGERGYLEKLLTTDFHDGGLTELVEVIESFSDGMICSILLMNDDATRLHSAAAISLPDEFSRAVDGMEIGPNAGSCGTAAFLNQTVIVSDIAIDSRWDDFRDVALKHGLCSCWSVPIRSTAGNVLGTFAMYYREPRAPDSYHRHLIDRAVHLAAIAIDRRNSVSAVREGEQRFRIMFESVPECIKLLDDKGNLLDMNEAGLKFIEADSISQVRGESVYSLIAPEYLDEFVAKSQAVFRGESNTHEFEIIGLRGTRRRMETHQVPLLNDAGRVTTLLAVTRDVTKRRKTEAELNAIFEMSLDLICVAELETARFVKVNPSFMRVLGYSEEELVSRPFLDFVHPDDVAATIDVIDQDLKHGTKVLRFENRYRTKAGDYRWLAWTTNPNLANGLTYSIAHDITERKRADELLKGLVEGTSSATGSEFFSSFVTTLARVFQTRYVLVCEHLDSPVTRVRTLAFWMGDQLIDEVQYALAGGPCEETAAGEMTFYPGGIQSLFPDDHDLVDMSAESYCGIPLSNSTGEVIGHLAILDDRPMDFNLCDVPLLQFFVSRAAAELERKRTENALRESELRLQTVISDAPVVIQSIDSSGEIGLFQGRGLESVDFRPGQFTGENYFELWKDRPDITAAMRKCLSGIIPEPTRVEVSDRLLETRYSPIRDEEGDVSGAITVCVDITERIQAEEQFREKNALLEGITQLQREFLVDTDPHQSFDQILDLLIEVTESEYGFIAEVVHRDDGTPYLKTYALTNIAWDDATRTFYEQNAPTGLEFENLETLFGAVLKTGETVIANDAPNDPRANGIPPGHPAMNSFLGLPFFHAGELVGVIGLANRAAGYDERIIGTLTPILATCASLVHAYDLDRKRKQAENALLDSETRLRTMLEGSPVCTKIIDLDSHLQYMSAAGQQQLKIVDIEPFYGCTFPPKLYPEAWRAPVIERLERAKRGEISSLECPVLDTEGNEVWFDTTFVPARNDDGRIQYIIVTSVNVTERRQAEEDARRHRNELAHVSRISTMGEMATGIAHELNQPLAAIASYSYAAKTVAEQSPAIPQEFQEILGKLGEQAVRAGDIVRRLRNFMKKADSVHTRIDLNALVRDVANFVEPDIHQANVELHLVLHDSSPEVVIDEIQIQQVLVNLIRNSIDAMQETPDEQREMTVEVRIRHDGQAEVVVKDAGEGLDQSELEQIFNAFFTTKREGMGMGLPISRSIVEAHEGTLWAEPNNGRGMTFGFTLPWKSGRQPEMLPNVFIVDDESAMRDSLRILVATMGLSAKCFASATEFLEYILPRDVSHPACLIADIQMPQMNGTQLVQQVKALGKQFPVVLISAHGTDALKQKAIELGVSIFLEKPFRPDELKQIIASCLRQQTVESSAN